MSDDFPVCRKCSSGDCNGTCDAISETSKCHATYCRNKTRMKYCDTCHEIVQRFWRKHHYHDYKCRQWRSQNRG